MRQQQDKTKLCETCRGTGTEEDSPRFAGDVDEPVAYATLASKCKSCDGKGRVPLGH